MVWQSVPEHLTMTKKEAYSRYKQVDVFEQLVHSISNDSNKDKWGCPVPTKCPMKDGEVDCYIMKGAKKQVMRTYAWQNSHTDGGYVVEVIRRYLHRKYTEEASIIDAVPDDDFETIWDLEEAWSKKHRKEAWAIINVMRQRYYLQARTLQSVKNRF